MVGFTNVRQKHIYNTYGVNKQGQREIINHAVKHIKKKKKSKAMGRGCLEPFGVTYPC